MSKELVFQFTPAETPVPEIQPADGVNVTDISQVAKHSYEINISNNSKITVSFDNTIRYIINGPYEDIAEQFSQAKKDIRESIQTSLVHFNLQVIFDDTSVDIEREFLQDIERIARDESLGKYTSTDLSTGSTMISFSSYSQSIIV